MDTTVDAMLIGKMIHSDCSQHHCRKHKKGPRTGANRRQTSAPLVAERWPPEFLHCGVWPPPQKPLGTEVQVYPDNIPNIDGDVMDSESSDSGLDGSEDGHGEAIPIQPTAPLRVAGGKLSDAVDVLKLVSNTSGEDKGLNGNKKFSTPYSVLKLIARHSNGAFKQTSPPQAMPDKKSNSLRKNLFDQELQAENQARVEMTDYLDSLVDSGEFEEGYGCVWPLEDYRRTGWSNEMVATYPGECAEFVGKVRDQLENLNQRERGGMTGVSF